MAFENSSGSDSALLRKKIFLAFAVVLFSSLVLDQVTKIHAESTLLKYAHESDLKIYQGSSRPVFRLGQIATRDPGLFFGFTYVRNQGAAWGMLNDWNDTFRIPFFYGVTLVAIVIIIFFFRSMPIDNIVARYALVLVFSGAIGNFIDRLRLGYVIDWIDFKWNFFGLYYDFPMFNIADSCISVGIGLLMVDTIFLEKRRVARRQKNA